VRRVAVIWQGSSVEFDRLQVAVARNCECVVGMLGLPSMACSAHVMLADQNALNHLLYVYRTRRVFITREFYAFPLREKPRLERAA
jgi:hypothetical protein